jgi:hypothetical protein
MRHSNKMAAFSDDHSLNFGFPCVPWLTIRETALFRTEQCELSCTAVPPTQRAEMAPRCSAKHVSSTYWNTCTFLGINLLVLITPSPPRWNRNGFSVSYRMITGKMSGLPNLFYISYGYSRDFQWWTCRMNYSQTTVHELNSFLKVVRKPKLFSPRN